MKKALIGKGGHSREVASLLPFPVETFTEDKFLLTNYKQYEVMVAVGDPLVRHHIVKLLPDDVTYFTYIHHTVVLGSHVSIGVGSFVGPFCVITTNIEIGDHSILLRGNHIGHDSTLGSFSSLMSGAVVNGNCSLGDQCYLGTNSSIKEKVTLCDKVILGMNGCVIKNLEYPGTYVGVPCYKVK